MGKQTVRVSPKFQVVIPLPIREALGLIPGARIQVFHYENRIEFIPEEVEAYARLSTRHQYHGPART